MKYLIVVLGAVLMGCGASGPKLKKVATAGPDDIVVYLYRPDTMIGIINADVPFVHVDGELLTRIRIGGYISRRLKPGRHTITTTESFLGDDTGKVRGEIVFEAPGGTNVYLRYTEKFKTFNLMAIGNIVTVSSTGDYRFEVMAAETALEELKELERLEAGGK